MMKIRKWLEKRPTLILREPLIKKLGSPYHEYAFFLGEHCEGLRKDILDKDKDEVWRHLGAIKRWSETVGINERTKSIIEEIKELVDRNEWEEALLKRTELSLHIASELKKFREPPYLSPIMFTHEGFIVIAVLSDTFRIIACGKCENEPYFSEIVVTTEEAKRLIKLIEQAIELQKNLKRNE